MILYQHVNNTDVAIEIKKKIFVKANDMYKLEVRWWDVGWCHDPWNMKIEQNIEIKRWVWLNEWIIYWNSACSPARMLEKPEGGRDLYKTPPVSKG